MKAIILHGTSSYPGNNWFPWLKSELEERGIETWVPQLPDCDKSDIKKYNKFLLGAGWDFSDNILIGHSSGAVAVLGLLQVLPEGVNIKAALLAGVYRGNIGREDLKGTDIAFDYEKIKRKAGKFYVLHSDNDPYCPLDGAQWIGEKLDAEFRLLPGYAHFGLEQNPKFKRFPELLEIIDQKVL